MSVLGARVRDALAQAGFGPRLAGRRVTVVVPDPTRPLDLGAVLPPLFADLEGAQVTVMVGVGLHRPLTEAERAPLEALCERAGAQLRLHSADDPFAFITACTNLGGTDRPLPAVLHEAVVEADARVLVGIVEPHQYAGFSGGAKAVAIGCAGRATISALHGLDLLRDPGTRIGRLEGNRFQAALWRIVGGLDPVFAVQVVPTEPPEVFAGPARAAFEAAAQIAGARLFEDHPARFPAVFTAVPEAKAQSFYQASRALTYMTEVDAPVIAPGGAVILEAACPEGLGLGAGERAFAEALALGPDRLLDILEGRAEPEGPSSGGAQRAYVLARALSRFRLALVGAPDLPALAAFGVVQAATRAQAEAALGLEAPAVELSDVFRRVPRYRSPACDS